MAVMIVVCARPRHDSSCGTSSTVACLRSAREEPESTSSMKAPCGVSCSPSAPFFSDLPAFFFFDFFLGRSHSQSGMNESTYTSSGRKSPQTLKLGGALTNPTSANNLGNIHMPGLATSTVMI